jgi:hypothetical protein
MSRKKLPTLKSGYYWLKKIGFDAQGHDTVIFRPVEVSVFEEAGYHFRGEWNTAGTYVHMLGYERPHTIEYFYDWTGVEFIPLPMPKDT